MSVLAKLKIGERRDLDIFSVVFTLFFFSSSVGSLIPLAFGFVGSKKPTGFFSEATNSKFNIAWPAS